MRNELEEASPKFVELSDKVNAGTQKLEKMKEAGQDNTEEYKSLKKEVEATTKRNGIYRTGKRFYNRRVLLPCRICGRSEFHPDAYPANKEWKLTIQPWRKWRGILQP